MPGRPKRQRLIAALEQRTRAELGDNEPGEAPFTPLDLAVAHIASGGTILGLAREIAAEIGEPISRELLSRLLHTNYGPEADRRLNEARKQGAHAMVEEAREIVDNAPVQRDAINHAKMRADARTWLASRFNREAFGEQRNVQVSVSPGQLHLQALQHRAAREAEARLLHAAAPAQLATPSEVVDAEIVEVVETSDE